MPTDEDRGRMLPQLDTTAQRGRRNRVQKCRLKLMGNCRTG